MLSALVGLCFVALHYLLEAARMGGEVAGALDPSHCNVWCRNVASRSGGDATRRARAHRGRAESRRSRDSCAFGPLASRWLSIPSRSSDTRRHIPSHDALRGLLLAHLIVVVFWFGALVPLYRASRDESAGDRRCR